MSENIPEYEFCNEQVFDNQIRNRLESIAGNLPIGFSGNPFVDAGLVAVSVIQRKEMHEITLKDLIEVFRTIGGNDSLGKDFAERNAATKAAFMIIPNNPLIQSAFGKTNTKVPCLKKALKAIPSPTQRNVYRAYLTEFLAQIPYEVNSANRCISCGRESTLDFNRLEIRLEELRTKEPTRRTFGTGVTKAWFPLIGTIGSEAQALPAFSEPQIVCARCLFLVQFLPQITYLFQGQLAVYQSDNFAISRKLIESNLERFEELFKASNLKDTINIVGKKDPPGHIVLQLLDVLRQFNEELKGSTLIIWQFTNSNQETRCNTYFLPDRTLNFLRILSLNADFHAEKEIRRFITSENKILKHPDRYLFSRIIRSEDYEGFYVKTNDEPPNVDFYNFYQMYFLGWNREHLNAIRSISARLRKKKKDNDLKRLYKEWKRRDVLDQVIPTALDLQLNRQLPHSVLLDLFFSMHSKNRESNFLDLFKFYLHPKQDGISKSSLEPTTPIKREIPKDIANRIGLVTLIMENYLNRRKIDLDSQSEIEKFQKEVGRYTIDNIRTIYLYNSTKLLGMTYRQFHEFLEREKQSSLLHLFRIVATALLLKERIPYLYKLPEVKDLNELIESSSLSKNVCNGLIHYAEIRISKIGRNRFFREMDEELKRGKIGPSTLLNQINDRLLKEIEDPELIPESDWYDAGFDFRGNFSWKLLRFKLRIFYNQFKIWTETTTIKEE